MPPKKQKSKPNTGKLRIIGGSWRSRLLPVIEQEGLRPTTDRVRETLFNWLQGDIAGARCLDLFAGSGALGFEAASRGAAQVVMIEQSAAACGVLKKNVLTLQAQHIECYQADAMAWLKHNQQAFDLVFIDPPYASHLLQSACYLLEETGALSDHALIYLEQASHEAQPELPPSWQMLKHKKAGQIGYYLAKREPI